MQKIYYINKPSQRLGKSYFSLAMEGENDQSVERVKLIPGDGEKEKEGSEGEGEGDGEGKGKKVKVCLMFMYCGLGYQGLQRNPGTLSYLCAFLKALMCWLM
jgi:hypothetical protein